MDCPDKKPQVKRRPKLFRALGANDPPTSIEIDGSLLNLQNIIKHDSWAATSVYANDNKKVVCKFNRTQPIFFLPMRWLGRRLANRENRMYKRLADLPNISEGFDQVFVAGKLAKNASAHEFIEGHPLRWHDRVNDSFFGSLRSLLTEIHARNVAYVDMNKCENIIVDESGAPNLIDFQISMRLPAWGPLGFILRILQKSDLYHLEKHAIRMRPDLYDTDQMLAFEQSRPWWIRLHRKVAKPWRHFRRWVLVKAGVRKGHGKPQSEEFVEEGLQAVGNESKPVLKLYELLMSPKYVENTGNSSHVEKVLEDIAPQLSPSEYTNLIGLLHKVSTHDQVSGILKLPQVITVSQHWDSKWVEAKIEKIEARLHSAQITNNKAA